VFFFQAEDGIRDSSVTGVQTCALPIWNGHDAAERGGMVQQGGQTLMTSAIRFHKTGGPEVLVWEDVTVGKPGPGEARIRHTAVRSEERRVGTEGRDRSWREKKTKN